MTTHRIASVEALRYPTIRVTFDDGIAGILDLTDHIANGPVFAPLKDETYFRTVAVGQDGWTFGWNLDDLGHEIDFCPNAARIQVETQIVEELARRFESTRAAAA
jgi:hypothetical protein